MSPTAAKAEGCEPIDVPVVLVEKKAADAGDDVYPFKRKPNYTAQYTIFNGATSWQWGGVLSSFFCCVEWNKYWARVVFVCLTSFCISILAVLEAPFCWLALRRQRINERPVFILGHPRSGTTLLHNMIALDTERFAYCNTLACLFPSVFFILGRLRCMFEAALPATRPMDNVPLGFDLPQEDEVAAALLTGGFSPFLLFFFGRPEHRRRLLDTLDFYRGPDGTRKGKPSDSSTAVSPTPTELAANNSSDAANNDVDAMEAGGAASASTAPAPAVTAAAAGSNVAPMATVQCRAEVSATAGAGRSNTAAVGDAAELGAPQADELQPNRYYKRWERCWLHFLRKVSYSVGTDRRLLLKSPAHTGRVRAILKLFPNAQFIYIHRDPYEVFQSMARMVGSISGLSCLYDGTDAEYTDMIFEQYKVMFDAYEADRELIPQGSLVEMSYAHLEEDPVAMLEDCYRRLGWQDAPMSTWRAYVAAHHGSRYHKNSHSMLAGALRRRITREWAPAFARFGYAPEDEDVESELAPAVAAVA